MYKCFFKRLFLKRTVCITGLNGQVGRGRGVGWEELKKWGLCAKILREGRARLGANSQGASMTLTQITLTNAFSFWKKTKQNKTKRNKQNKIFYYFSHLGHLQSKIRGVDLVILHCQRWASSPPLFLCGL